MSILLDEPRFWYCYLDRPEKRIIADCNNAVHKVWSQDKQAEFLKWVENMSGSKLCVEQFKKYGECEWTDL